MAVLTYDTVHRLVDAGHTAEEIAQHTEKQVPYIRRMLKKWGLTTRADRHAELDALVRHCKNVLSYRDARKTMTAAQARAYLNMTDSTLHKSIHVSGIQLPARNWQTFEAVPHYLPCSDMELLQLLKAGMTAIRASVYLNVPYDKLRVHIMRLKRAKLL